MTDEQSKPASRSPEEDLETRQGRNPEDHPDRPGAEGGSGSDDATALPSHPSDSDSELGDTDQHSSA
jgi:hypothetical protein